MFLTNEAEIKKELEERRLKLKRKSTNPPTNPALIDAHNRKEDNINEYVCEIGEALLMFNYMEDDIYLADKRGLEAEKKAVPDFELNVDGFVQIWIFSVYDEQSDTSRDYYVIYCTPISNL